MQSAIVPTLELMAPDFFFFLRRPFDVAEKQPATCGPGSTGKTPKIHRSVKENMSHLIGYIYIYLRLFPMFRHLQNRPIQIN